LLFLVVVVVVDVSLGVCVVIVESGVAGVAAGSAVVVAGSAVVGAVVVGAVVVGAVVVGAPGAGVVVWANAAVESVKAAIAVRVVIRIGSFPFGS
jgi:hypothetical protein